MFRLILPAILVLTSAVHDAPAEIGQLDASPTLFTVMAAINAAGYDAELQSPNNVQLRRDIRAEIARRNPPSLHALKIFFGRHKRSNDTEEHFVIARLARGIFIVSECYRQAEAI